MGASEYKYFKVSFVIVDTKDGSKEKKDMKVKVCKEASAWDWLVKQAKQWKLPLDKQENGKYITRPQLERIDVQSKDVDVRSKDAVTPVEGVP